MVFGLAPIVRRPLEFAFALESHLVGRGGVQEMLGVQTGFDAFGQVDFLLGVQQVDPADLLQVVLDRVGGGSRRQDATLGVASRSDAFLLVVIVLFADHEGALFQRLFLDGGFLFLVSFVLQVLFLRVGDDIFVILLDRVPVLVQLHRVVDVVQGIHGVAAWPQIAIHVIVIVQGLVILIRGGSGLVDLVFLDFALLSRGFLGRQVLVLGLFGGLRGGLLAGFFAGLGGDLLSGSLLGGGFLGGSLPLLFFRLVGLPGLA